MDWDKLLEKSRVSRWMTIIGGYTTICYLSVHDALTVEASALIAMIIGGGLGIDYYADKLKNAKKLG